jgi:hypothetical protein
MVPVPRGKPPSKYHRRTANPSKRGSAVGRLLFPQFESIGPREARSFQDELA